MPSGPHLSRRTWRSWFWPVVKVAGVLPWLVLCTSGTNAAWLNHRQPDPDDIAFALAGGGLCIALIVRMALLRVTVRADSLVSHELLRNMRIPATDIDRIECEDIGRGPLRSWAPVVYLVRPEDPAGSASGNPGGRRGKRIELSAAASYDLPWARGDAALGRRSTRALRAWLAAKNGTAVDRSSTPRPQLR